MEGSLQIRPHVRSMIDADGAVVLDLSAGKYYSPNGVGARIWQKAEEGLSLPQILTHLEASYPASASKLSQDLNVFIDGLQAKGLVDVDH